MGVVVITAQYGRTTSKLLATVLTLGLGGELNRSTLGLGGLGGGVEQHSNFMSLETLD